MKNRLHVMANQTPFNHRLMTDGLRLSVGVLDNLSEVYLIG